MKDNKYQYFGYEKKENTIVECIYCGKPTSAHGKRCYDCYKLERELRISDAEIITKILDKIGYRIALKKKKFVPREDKPKSEAS